MEASRSYGWLPTNLSETLFSRRSMARPVSPAWRARSASSLRSIAASKSRSGSASVPIFSRSCSSRPYRGVGELSPCSEPPNMFLRRLKTKPLPPDILIRVYPSMSAGYLSLLVDCYNCHADEGDQLAYEFARYLKIRGSWGAGWSPDGKRVSFLTEITGVPQVWEVAYGGPSWPEQLTFYEERISSAEYSPAEELLVFGMDAGGNERSQLFLLRDGEVTDLTNAPEAIHYPGGFSPDGERIAFTATRRNGTDFDVFVQDVPDGELETVWEVSGYHTVADWAPDGKVLIVSRHHSNVDNDLYRLDLQTGEATLLTPHEGDAHFSGANVTPDGESLYLATDRDGEFLRLARLHLATLDLHYLTPDDWDVEGVELSRDGRYLVVSRNVDGYSDVLLFNGRGTRMPDPQMPEGIVGGFQFSPDSKKLAFTLTAPERNPDVWSLDLPNSEARRLTRSSTAGIPPSTFRKPRVVRYPTFDGREIPALFHEPEAENAPVIINVHGGPESQARPAFAPVTQYLLSRGYAVFFPNVRGSTGYGKEYTHLDDVRLRMDSVKDLAHAAYWLGERGHERVAVMGGSYGGVFVVAARPRGP